MPREINLLPESIIKLRRQESVKRAAQLISILVLIIAVGVSLFLIVRGYSLGSDLVQTNKTIDARKKEIDSLRSIEDKNIIVKQKLESLNIVLNDNPYYKNTITAIVQTLPPGISLSQVKVNETNTLEISGQASGSAALKNLIVKLTENEETRKIFPKVTLKSAGLNLQDKNYLFSFTLKVVPEKTEI